MANKNWLQSLRTVLNGLVPAASIQREYLDANVASVEQLIRGIGPDDTVPSAGAGACIVVNIAATHVESFCQLSEKADKHPYKNAYQLRPVTGKRLLVDEAIVEAYDSSDMAPLKEEICFAAVETNGAGIRFFGDMCLVLRFRPNWKSPGDLPDQSPDWELQEVRVLERNSYDVSRAPVAARVQQSESTGTPPRSARAEHIRQWMGSWGLDLIPMLASRIVQELPATDRRWTSGQIARAVLDDEDYCEVLYPRSFAAKDVAEVRMSAADVAAEADIANRENAGDAPEAHELEWRRQRRAARRALHRMGIPIRIVTSHARRRGS